MHRAGIAEGVEAIVDLADIAIEYPKRGRTPASARSSGSTLQIGRGEVIGLVGESGSGKTTIGRALVGLLPIVEGTASVVGIEHGRSATQGARARVRKDVSFVFQDPGSSLNPRLPIGESIGEPLLLHGEAKGAELEQAGGGTARPGAAAPGDAQPLPARALRRPAAAGRHRPGARAGARSC